MSRFCDLPKYKRNIVSAYVSGSRLSDALGRDDTLLQIIYLHLRRFKIKTRVYNLGAQILP
jgi:hypothetical protein